MYTTDPHQRSKSYSPTWAAPFHLFLHGPTIPNVTSLFQNICTVLHSEPCRQDERCRKRTRLYGDSMYPVSHFMRPFKKILFLVWCTPVQACGLPSQDPDPRDSIRQVGRKLLFCLLGHFNAVNNDFVRDSQWATNRVSSLQLNPSMTRYS